MTNAAILFFLWLFGSKDSSAAPAPAPIPRPSPTGSPFPRPTSPARPVANRPVSNDTTFPGPNWEPATPVAPEVIARATALLPVLWAEGEGAATVETTGGRQIGYLATAMPGGKRGVTAWRLKSYAPQAPLAPAPAPVAPLAPSVAPEPPAPSLAPVAPLIPVANTDQGLGLPTLQLGARGPDVVTLQRRLGWTKVTDYFGPQTDAKVREFQRAQGLPANGIVDSTVWSRLFASAA